MYKSRFNTYLGNKIFYVVLLVFSLLTALMSPQKGTYYAIISIYIFYYLIYAQAEKLFNGLIWFVTLTLSIYYPIACQYGEPNTAIIAALFETNPSESWEFIKSFKYKWSDFQLPLIFALFGYIVLRLKKIHQKGSDNKRVLHTALWIIFLFSAIWEPVQFIYEQSRKGNDIIKEDRRWTLLSKSPVNLFSFYVNIYDSIIDYFYEKQELENAAKQPSPWRVKTITPKYQNYVLIIGESARLDHLSAYGFSLPTSPFLATTNGYINSGYVSAAPGTYHSLLYTLYFKEKNSDKINYSYHIINLAKSAGFRTVWLSNQGSIGTYDTLASRIGKAADMAEFIKKYSYRVGNESDDKLVDLLKNQLAEPSDKPTLFVLHLMGSHQNYCDRVDNKPVFDYINKSLSCYTSSILKTDQLLENVVKQLTDKKQPYSLIYFSDHGLAYSNKESKDTEKITLDYDEKFKENYRVPFAKISSDDQQRIVVNTPRSAMRFIEGFAQWLGIETEELAASQDFFSSRPDDMIKIFNFTDMVDFNSLEDDPLLELNKLEAK